MHILETEKIKHLIRRQFRYTKQTIFCKFWQLFKGPPLYYQPLPELNIWRHNSRNLKEVKKR